MFNLERDYGDWILSAYRYDGSRALAALGYGGTIPISGVPDRFWRMGYDLGWHRAKTEVDAVYQTGNDSSADVYGDRLTSSGGFVQVRQALDDRTFAIARWDATQDAAFNRSVTAGLGYRLSRNTRLTVFGTINRDPDTGLVQHVLSSSFLIAY